MGRVFKDTKTKTFIQSTTMVALLEYREVIGYSSREEVAEERAELFKIIKGDTFSPLKTWPGDLQRAFWPKPVGDKETFQLMLFTLGNSCPRFLISRWILTSQTWAPGKAEKRARQIDFIVNNEDGKRSQWFYFDLDHRKLLCLNGLPRQENTRR